MKSLRLTVIFAIVAATIIGILSIAGVIDSATANSTLTKFIGIIFLVGVSSLVIGTLAQKPKSPAPPQNDEPGPKF